MRIGTGEGPAPARNGRRSKRQPKKDKKAQSSTSTTWGKELRAKAKVSAGPAAKRATERQNPRKARASQTLGTGRAAAEVGIKADIMARAKEARAKARPAKEGG